MSVRREVSAHELLRRRAGFSVTELARELGVSHTYVSRVESGEIGASPRYREAAAGALGVYEADLFPAGGVVVGLVA